MGAKIEGLRNLGKTIKKQTKKGLKKGLKKGAQQRIENVMSGGGVKQEQPFSGGSVTQPSTATQSSTGLKSWGKWIIIGLVVVIIFSAKPLYSECMDSGFCEIKIIGPLREPAETFQDAFGYIGGQIKQSAAWVRGEKTFSWTGGAEEEVRSGIWFRGGSYYDIGAYVETATGELKETLGKEFGAVIGVVIGKFDKDIKFVDSKIECSLKNVRGIIRGANKQGEYNLRLANPLPEIEEEYPLGCYYIRGSEDIEQLVEAITKVEEGRTYFSEDIVFNLTYSLNSNVSLPVFLVDDSFYDEYYYKRSDVFEDLAGGIYKDEYSGGIRSKMGYITDVEAVMKFVQEPLFLRDYIKDGVVVDNILFGVQFKNKNSDGRAGLKRFKFKLPDGLSMGSGISALHGETSCEYFIPDGNGYRFNEEYLSGANKQLNKGNFEAGPYICRVRIDSVAEEDFVILDLGPVIGELTYEYTISDSVKISN